MIFKQGRNNSGFTLIEVVIVITFFGLILGGMYTIFTKVSGDRKLTETKQDINEIVSNTRDYFSGRNINVAAAPIGDNYIRGLAANQTAFLTAMIRDAQVFSRSCGISPPVCSNPYDGESGNRGEYNMDLSPAAGGDKFALTLQATNLPQDACINLAMNFGSSLQNPTGFIGLAGGMNFPPAVFPVITLGPQGNVGNAGQPCAAANGNQLFFVFRL